MFILLWGLVIFANSSYSQPNIKQVSLYEYGREVACDSDNFVNLQNNIDLIVDKEGCVQVRDIAWKYMGDVLSEKQVRTLVAKNYKNLPIGALICKFPEMTNGKSMLNGRSTCRFLPYRKEMGDKKVLKEKACDAAAHAVKIGDRIYELSMTADYRPYTTYVFVDRNTHKVITEGGCNVFGYSVPKRLISDKIKKRNWEQHLAHRNQAPEWAKQILTPEEINTILNGYSRIDSIIWTPLKQVAFDRARVDSIIKDAKEMEEYNATHPEVRDSRILKSWTMQSFPWNVKPAQPITFFKGDTITATYLAYSQLDNYDAHVLIDLAYKRVGDELEIVSLNYRPYSLGGRPVNFEPFDRNYVEFPQKDGTIKKTLKSKTGGLKESAQLGPAYRKIKNYDYLMEWTDNGRHTIRGDIKGTLTFYNAEFKKQTERVSAPIELELP